MPRPDVIFLQFKCVSQDYWVHSPNAPGLLLYVLDSSPDLANWLYGAINRAYRDYPWSSPGDTPVRTLYAWLDESERYPELERSPQREEILARLRDLRERMVQAVALMRWIRRSAWLGIGGPLPPDRMAHFVGMRDASGSRSDPPPPDS